LRDDRRIEGVFMTTGTADQSAAIVALMSIPDEDKDIEWLKQALQHAMILELATIPPYSCGLWSIEDQGEEVAKTIKEIIFDEMSHFGLVGNMLSAIGGTPILTGDVLPHFPGPLPGGVRPELTVHLAGLNRFTLEMYSAIEAPDEPLARFAADATYTSIGAFYAKIDDVFKQKNPTLDPKRLQITSSMSSHGPGNAIVRMEDLTIVETSLKIIMEQGEGTSASPVNSWSDVPVNPLVDVGEKDEEKELAHYYAFREMYRGHKLIQGADGKWSFTGDRITLPQTYAVAEVPAGGWNRNQLDDEVRTLLEEFNNEYSGMLHAFEEAWSTDPASLGKAIGHMGNMREKAREIMQKPLPGDTGWRYCPEFLYEGVATA
jgi:hypothetical protein